jgi:hypothetical protein
MCKAFVFETVINCVHIAIELMLGDGEQYCSRPQSFVRFAAESERCSAVVVDQLGQIDFVDQLFQLQVGFVAKDFEIAPEWYCAGQRAASEGPAWSFAQCDRENALESTSLLCQAQAWTAVQPLCKHRLLDCRIKQEYNILKRRFGFGQFEQWLANRSSRYGVLAHDWLVRRLVGRVFRALLWPNHIPQSGKHFSANER